MREAADILLSVGFLFMVGALGGWVLEFLFRNLVTHKGPKTKIFINPGFCKGPYLPIYGIGLASMYLISQIILSIWPEVPAWLVVIIIAVLMTVIEFIGGLFLLKVLNMRLWDYSRRPGNIMGIICPLFSLIWAAIGAGYYLLLHPLMIGLLVGFFANLAFSFFVGLFFGVFFIDLFSSTEEAAIIKAIGDDQAVIVQYEELKAIVAEKRRAEKQKSHFFNQLATGKDKLTENVEEYRAAMEDKKVKLKKTKDEKIDKIKKKKEKRKNK